MRDLEERLRDTMARHQDAAPSSTGLYGEVLRDARAVNRRRSRARSTTGIVAGVAAAVAAVAVVGAVVATRLSDLARTPGQQDGNAAQCAAVLNVDDSAYVDRGPVKRMPVVTGHTVRGHWSPCQDGEDPNGSVVQASTIQGIDQTRALLVGRRLFLPADADLTSQMSKWFTPVACSRAGDAFTLTGAWAGLSGPETGSGLVPKPFTVDMNVSKVEPSRPSQAYLGAQVTVTVEPATDSTLTYADVKHLFSTDGFVRASVKCVNGRYVATALGMSR